MKKLTLSGLIVLFLISYTQLVGGNLNILVSDIKTNTKVLNSSQQSMNLKFHFGNIGHFNVKTPQGVYTELLMGNAYTTNRIGEPILPAQKKLIAIPFGAEVSIKVDSYTESVINLEDFGIKNTLMPLQYDIPKNIDPADVPFQYKKEVYESKNYIKNNIAAIEVLGVMRGVRIARVTIEPIQYNPSTNQLKVYNDIEVSITYQNANWETTNQIFNSTYSPFFDVAYQHLLNIDNVYDDHPDLLTFPVNMLIVADPMFADALQPFIEWKTLMGYYLTVAYTDEIGTSSSEIKTWVHNQYNAGVASGNAPDFVVFVGDVQQVPASATGTESGKMTDLYYASVDGDMFPEMYYGRLSAQTVPQLEAQVNKILYYEKYEFETPEYLDRVTLIAGADASGNPNYGQPTITYGTENYFNTDHGYSDMNVYLTSPYTGCYDDERIRVSFINYTAHCGQTSWADPNLEISDVYNFDNPNEYPIAIGNCCLAADFGYDECIGEAWLRAENKGAAGYIGSSPSSYWKSDMYWSVGAYPMTNDNGGGYVPTYEETTTGAYDGTWGNSYYCLDAIAFVGNLSVSEVNMQGWLNDASSLYYWEAYNTLGDPSMMPYNTQGTENTVSHMDILPIGVTQFEVTAQPGSYVAITKDGVLHGTGFADDNGIAVVELDPILDAGDVSIVVTKSQFIPYITTIPAAVLEGPFLTLSNFVFDNGSTTVNYATSSNMDITISNLGTNPSEDVTVTISFTDDYCTLTSPTTITVGTIAANDAITIEDAFSFDIADDAPDMHTVEIEVQIEGTSKEIWESSIDFDIYAPLVDFGLYTIDDTSGNDNGRIDPGETVDITVQIINNGHAATLDGVTTVGTTCPYIVVNTNEIDVNIINASDIQYVTYSVTAEPNTPIGTLADFNLNYIAGNYSALETNYETIGLIVEDFETGDFTRFNWSFNDNPWIIVDGDDVYESNYSAKSALITDNESSVMELEYTSIADDEFSFFFKVSSEQGYDFLRFFVNGNLQDEWSGEIDWTEKIYAIPAGHYTFKWEYVKDYSLSSGSDAAWIDYIVLPPMLVTSVFAGPDAEICDGSDAQCAGAATNYDTIFWHSTGTGSFNDINSLNPIYTPSEDDYLSGMVQLSLNLIDNEQFPASDTMELSFNSFPGESIMPAGPVNINVHDIAQSDYTTDSIQNADIYLWSIYPSEAGEISGTNKTGTIIWSTEFEGDAWVKVIGSNNCGIGITTDSLLVSVINYDDIYESNKEVVVTISPNPTKGLFTLNLYSFNQKEVEINIVNQLGVTVYSNNAILNNGRFVMYIDLSSQPSGSYFVSAKTHKGISISKLIITE